MDRLKGHQADRGKERASKKAHYYDFQGKLEVETYNAVIIGTILACDLMCIVLLILVLHSHICQLNLL